MQKQTKLQIKAETDPWRRKGSTEEGSVGETGRDLKGAAGTVKDVLRWETPGEGYAEARRLSSIVGR